MTSQLLEKALKNFTDIFYKALSPEDINKRILYDNLVSHKDQIADGSRGDWTQLMIEEEIGLPTYNTPSYFKHLKVLHSLLALEFDEEDEITIVERKEPTTTNPQFQNLFSQVYSKLNDYVSTNNVDLQSLSSELLPNMNNPALLMENPLIKDIIGSMAGSFKMEDLQGINLESLMSGVKIEEFE